MQRPRTIKNARVNKNISTQQFQTFQNPNLLTLLIFLYRETYFYSIVQKTFYQKILISTIPAPGIYENQLSYVECRKLAAPYQDADDDSCKKVPIVLLIEASSFS